MAVQLGIHPDTLYKAKREGYMSKKLAKKTRKADRDKKAPMVISR